jgi:hypothetical protein
MFITGNAQRYQTFDVASLYIDRFAFVALASEKLNITKASQLCGLKIGYVIGGSYVAGIQKFSSDCAAAGKPAISSVVLASNAAHGWRPGRRSGLVALAGLEAQVGSLLLELGDFWFRASMSAVAPSLIRARPALRAPVPGQFRPTAGRLRASGFSPAGHGAGKGGHGRPWRRAMPETLISVPSATDADQHGAGRRAQVEAADGAGPRPGGRVVGGCAGREPGAGLIEDARAAVHGEPASPGPHHVNAAAQVIGDLRGLFPSAASTILACSTSR